MCAVSLRLSQWKPKTRPRCGVHHPIHHRMLIIGPHGCRLIFWFSSVPSVTRAAVSTTRGRAEGTISSRRSLATTAAAPTPWSGTSPRTTAPAAGLRPGAALATPTSIPSGTASPNWGSGTTVRTPTPPCSQQTRKPPGCATTAVININISVRVRPPRLPPRPAQGPHLSLCVAMR